MLKKAMHAIAGNEASRASGQQSLRGVDPVKRLIVIVCIPKPRGVADDITGIAACVDQSIGEGVADAIAVWSLLIESRCTPVEGLRGTGTAEIAGHKDVWGGVDGTTI